MTSNGRAGSIPVSGTIRPQHVDSYYTLVKNLEDIDPTRVIINLTSYAVVLI